MNKNRDNFKHKHKFGQNFLKDKNVLMKMIDSAEITENDLIIEIGPGQGALTKYLKLYKASLLCFEIDKETKEYLKSYEDEKTKIIYEDFMKVNLNEILKTIKYKKLYIMANLPYYITTPIIEKIIESKIEVESMTLMVQNEVADRLSAVPRTKNYGYMTVYLNYYYDVKKIIFVDRTSFEPIPNVDSAVIKLTKKSRIKVKKESFLFQLVKDSFSMKRKNIKNNLKKYDLNKIESILNKYNLTTQNRAEDISLDCFIEMANTLSE